MFEFLLSLKIVAISNDSDNPIFDGIYDFCQMYCGASIGLLLPFILDSKMLPHDWNKVWIRFVWIGPEVFIMQRKQKHLDSAM